MPLSDRDPVCSVGKWLFVPDRRNAAGDVLRTGYLSCNGERVVLRHCSRLLADFLRTIRQIEENFAARIGAEPAAVEG
ncbi:hypothetical protein GCM10010442_09190 [Kitasatospora kifunensis]